VAELWVGRVEYPVTGQLTDLERECLGVGANGDRLLDDAVEQRVPIRIGLPADSAAAADSMGGPGFHVLPGSRSAGTATASSSRSARTRMKRAVWYFAAVFPPRVRQALPAGVTVRAVVAFHRRCGPIQKIVTTLSGLTVR
jgi:uncharacterized membrane protein